MLSCRLDLAFFRYHCIYLITTIQIYKILVLIFEILKLNAQLLDGPEVLLHMANCQVFTICGSVDVYLIINRNSPIIRAIIHSWNPTNPSFPFFNKSLSFFFFIALTHGTQGVYLYTFNLLRNCDCRIINVTRE